MTELHSAARPEPENEHAVDETLRIADLQTSVKPPPPPIEAPPQEKGKKHTRSGLQIELFKAEELAGDVTPIKMDQNADPGMPLESSGERYRMKRVLATGGFGKIFLAEDRLLGREMVIKSLKTDFVKKPEITEHFIAEARLCAQLNHPAIVPIYGLHKDNIDGLHIAMQRVNGITLQLYLERFHNYLQQHTVSHHVWRRFLNERLALFIRVCDAIAYCHERNVIHNDLKPSNIMIGNFNQVYVMDWGTASADNAVSPGDLQGTCSYMAPERLATRTATRKSDIFALGMILNELVTLRGPIREDKVSKVLERICTGNFEPSTCVFPRYRISSALQAIIEKARCPKPAERYDSVRQLEEDIRHYLFFEEIKARPDHIGQKIMRGIFRHQKIALSTVLLLIAAFCGLLFTSYYRRVRMEAQLKNEMLSNLYFQTGTDRLAYRVNQKFSLLQEQLRSLGSVFLHEMENRHSCRIPITIPMAEDLAPGSPRRPDRMIHTAFYRYPITLDSGVLYHFGSDGKTEDLRVWHEIFHAMQGQLLGTMFANSISGRNNIRNDQNKIFHLRECLIRRMIFLIGDRTVYCFPGMYGSEKSVRDFQTDFVRYAFRDKAHLFWTPVYCDRDGFPVLSCWMPVMTRQGSICARIGFEVGYRNLMNTVLKQAEKERHESIYAIVDSEGRVVFSTVTHHRQWQENKLHANRDAVSREIFYRFPELLRAIRAPGAPSHFTTVLNGWTCKIYWSTIPATNWLLIRHVPENPRISDGK